MTKFAFLEILYVAVLFGGYLALWSIKRYRQRRDTGLDPEVMGKATDRLQLYFSRVTKVLTGVVVLVIATHAAVPVGSWWLRRLPLFNVWWIDLLGLAVGVVGLVFCWIAQSQMGTSWRVGIDEEQQTSLITTGIYRYIRNPTYLGLFLVNGGFWIIWPTYAVAMFVLIFIFFLEVQVRCEEQYLLTAHDETYQHYLGSTKRYIPWLY